MSSKKAFGLAVLMAVTTSICPGARAVEEGAKGLFSSQLERPDQAINTGVQYWIELHRAGQVSHVNNRTSFKTGDRIRFHVKPNITGFAYILLKSGSRGEQSVLFPDPARSEDNHVTAGQDYALPADSYLAFDENPGTEKVTLLVSRTPVDASAYLTTPETGRTLIACAATGSKDLIPAKIVLAFAPPAAPMPTPIAEEHAAPPPAKATSQKKPARGHAKARAIARHQARPGARPAAKVTPSKPAQQDTGVVTVVKKDPSGVLTVEVALEHD